MRAIFEIIIMRSRIAIPDNAAFISFEEEIVWVLENRIKSREVATLQKKRT